MRHVMADGAAGRSAEQAVMASDMARNAAHGSAADAARGVRRRTGQNRKSKSRQN